MLAHLHNVPRDKNANNVRYYTPYENEINMKDIPYPVAVKDMLKFEKQNENISVNVFGIEGKEYYP